MLSSFLLVNFIWIGVKKKLVSFFHIRMSKGSTDTQALISVPAAIYTFDPSSNQWVGIDGGLSTLTIQTDGENVFWLCAVSVADPTLSPLKVLIHKDARYQKQTDTYHCLHLGASNFYGFNFGDFESATNFATVVKESLEILLGLSDMNKIDVKSQDITRPPPPKITLRSSGNVVKKKDSKSNLKSSSPRLSKKIIKDSPMKSWECPETDDEYTKIMSIINHIGEEQSHLKNRIAEMIKFVSDGNLVVQKQKSN